MLRLRLQRRGKKNYATYRVVVADQRAPIKGKFVADVGYYNPHTSEFKVETAEIEKWLSNGVQASPTVHNLLIENKIIKGDKVTSWRPKVKQKEAGTEKKTDDKTESVPTEQAKATKKEESNKDKKEKSE